MVNGYVLKKYAALLSSAMIPTVSYAVASVFYGPIIAIGVFLGAVIMSVLIATILLGHPFTAMLEGKGLLVLNIDSTGIIQPFIANVRQPYIKGKISKDEIINDVFDREAVLNLATAEQCAEGYEIAGKMYIIIDKNKYNKSKFGFMQWPTLIYNSQVKSLITKDFLSEQEKQGFAEHTMLYLNRKMEELTSIVRDFGRHVVEQLKPQEAWYQSAWVKILAFILVAALVIFLGIKMWPGLSQGFGQAASGLTSIKTPVTPR